VRYIVSQRLIPRADGNGCVAVLEILKLGPRTGQYIEHDDHPGQLLREAIKNGAAEGMQHFDGEIAKLVQAGVVDMETALAYATDAQALRHALGE
jgi:twitching motility protein PilT